MTATSAMMYHHRNRPSHGPFVMSFAPLYGLNGWRGVGVESVAESCHG